MCEMWYRTIPVTLFERTHHTDSSSVDSLYDDMNLLTLLSTYVPTYVPTHLPTYLSSKCARVTRESLGRSLARCCSCRRLMPLLERYNADTSPRRKLGSIDLVSVPGISCGMHGAVRECTHARLMHARMHARTCATRTHCRAAKAIIRVHT